MKITFQDEPFCGLVFLFKYNQSKTVQTSIWYRQQKIIFTIQYPNTQKMTVWRFEQKRTSRKYLFFA